METSEDESSYTTDFSRGIADNRYCLIDIYFLTPLCINHTVIAFHTDSIIYRILVLVIAGYKQVYLNPDNSITETTTGSDRRRFVI
jgi:hypothetical protein